MNGYLLAITVFVVTAGRLGDMFGRKRLFLAGTGALRARLGRLRRRRRRADADRRPRPAGGRRGADAAALAGDRLQRLPGRGAAAGAGDLGGDLGGGAGDRPAGRRRPGRNRLAGDLLDQPAGRRGRRSRSRAVAAPESTDPGAGPPDRLRRACSRSASGLTAVVLALVQARAWSGAGDRRARGRSASPRSAPSGGSSTGSREPIVDFALFRNGPYFGASAAAFALVGAYWAVMFFQPQYLQDVRGHSAVAQRPADPADHGRRWSSSRPSRGG